MATGDDAANTMEALCQIQRIGPPGHPAKPGWVSDHSPIHILELFFHFWEKWGIFQRYLFIEVVEHDGG